MKNCDYPLRHPKVHFGPADSFDYTPNAYFGLVKCVVLPPRGLFFPVLPYRVEGAGKTKKLVFPLCATCAKERNRDKCPHGEAERAIPGTWFSEELYLAVSKGYRILKISCVWDYGFCHHKGVFTRFVDKFYKLKTEASGYPASCTTPASKEAYIAEFARVEGIKLDPQKIAFNSPRRTGVKLILNSAWGKWSQREDRRTMKLAHSSVTFHKFVASDEWEDKTIQFLNAETVLMRAKSADSARRASTRGNFVQACVTTAHGSMLLYKQLELLGDRVLYYDTDSIFYRSEEGDIDPPKGNFGGQFTDVFSGDCRQFVALGPKNYAYLAGKAVVKVRGLTFNKTSSAIVNLTKMQTIAEDSIATHRSEDVERLATLDEDSGFVNRRENVPLGGFLQTRSIWRRK